MSEAFDVLKARGPECEHRQATEQVKQVTNSVEVDRSCLPLQVARFNPTKKETFKKWLAAVQSVAIRTRHQNRTVEQS